MSDRSEAAPAENQPTLGLRRAVRRGFAAGGIVALAVFVGFAVVPSARPLGLYLGLAIVLGLSLGLLVTIGLIAWHLVRLVE